MGLKVIVSILFALISVGLVWLVLFFPTKWLIPKAYVKSARWIISLVLGSSLYYFYFYTSPAYNHEFALLKQKDETYELMLTGERIYQSHDPISALSRATYSDSLILKLPRKKGLIKGNEILKEEGYPLSGSVEINDKQVRVKLYYLNYDDRTKDPLSYNGSYTLKE